MITEYIVCVYIWQNIELLATQSIWRQDHPRTSNNKNRIDEKVTQGIWVIRISFIIVSAVYLVNIPDCSQYGVYT